MTNDAPYAFASSTAPYEYPTSGSWIIGAVERTYGGIVYRFYPARDARSGHFSDTGFPADGSRPIRVDPADGTTSFPTVSGVTGKVGKNYPRLQRYSKTERETSGPRKGKAKQLVSLKLHQAVALLWGAKNTSGIPLSDAQCVDHLKEGNKLDWSLVNLEFKMQRANALKGMGFA